MQHLTTELIALCDYAMLDKTNKLSVIGIFNELNVVTFPGGLPSAFFVATLVGESNTEYELIVTVRDEEKKDIFPPLTLKTKTSFTGKNNLVINIGNFVFPRAGEYTLRIAEQDKEIGSTVVHVLHAKQSEQKYEYKQPN